ncbi:NAD(P)-binding Rossmann-fold superfamily protein isoform 2 [Hibiscus syriacus]|uniref:NAD(P)-binding Rossmann-fold superfamily protein isoform 2 n=1 Tax=Hibiscus syriacus TaxID=106335 RepID=A0A6A2Z9U7_HIBSY|nr:NAD(P)-binding Rossmann-fold superfamily protein isoform 2 [Hibiscus syriacus]
MDAASLQVSASSSTGKAMVGENDLLIVGPGVLGHLVAEKWREEHPGCQIYGQTVTTDHHDELLSLGINPLLKETKTDQKFPYVIFCAPPSKTPDYPGDIRLAALSWNGEGSFVFTSSSAPYGCNDNGPCDEDTPNVPIGRSPRTDNLLKAEKVGHAAAIAVLAASAAATSQPKAPEAPTPAVHAMATGSTCFLDHMKDIISLSMEKHQHMEEAE